MNMQKLRLAESTFLARYPGGFQHPDMLEIGKKHRVDAVSEQAQTLLAKKNFSNQAQILDDIIKVVSRSSMVSMFEKPKFRDYVNGLSRDDRAFLTGGFKKLLHGNQQKGFQDIVDLLGEGKIAKWSLLTICLLYYRPTVEVFVKPTTTKNVLKFFEIDDLVYHPRPSWAFYESYRNVINEMKAKVDPSLSPNNAAFTGFLMMTLNQ